MVNNCVAVSTSVSMLPTGWPYQNGHLPQHDEKELQASPPAVLHEAGDNVDEVACVLPLFERQAAIAANATALIFQQQSISYGELNARANRLAHYLQAQGVQPSSRVAICAAPGLETVTALLAIWKAGGAYVALEPGSPRLQEVLQDSGARVVLADAPSRKALQGKLADGLIVLDVRPPDWQSNLPASNLPVITQHAAQTAYLIYSTDSLGALHREEFSHRDLNKSIALQVDRFGFHENDVFLQLTPLALATAAWEWWSALTVGARLVLPPAEERADAAAIAALIRRHQVSIVQLTPELLDKMLAPELADSFPDESAFALHEEIDVQLSAELGFPVPLQSNAALPFECSYLFCHGAPLSADLLARAQRVVRAGVVNLYQGPTQTSASTAHALANEGCDAEGVRSGYFARHAMLPERFQDISFESESSQLN